MKEVQWKPVPAAIGKMELSQWAEVLSKGPSDGGSDVLLVVELICLLVGRPAGTETMAAFCTAFDAATSTSI